MMAPERRITFTSSRCSALNIRTNAKVASSPPTAALPKMKPSSTRSDLITVPAMVENLSVLRKLSAIPRALIARLLGWTRTEGRRQRRLNTLLRLRDLGVNEVTELRIDQYDLKAFD